jgi:hypothetical protein
LQLLSAHVKLLLDAPERLWRLIERKEYFSAAWLFLLARVVHRALVSDDELDESSWSSRGIDVLVGLASLFVCQTASNRPIWRRRTFPLFRGSGMRSLNFVCRSSTNQRYHYETIHRGRRYGHHFMRSPFRYR